MSDLRRVFGTAVAAVLLTAATAPPEAWGGAGAPSARLRRLVVVGDSLLAGFGSGGLVVRGRPAQRSSATALLARRAGVPLAQPFMSRPGFPPQLTIDDRNGNERLDTGEVRRTASSIGFRREPGQRARNLSVPGESVESVFDAVTPADVLGGLVTGDTNGRDLMKLAILGLPPNRGPNSQVDRAQALAPTFIIVWLGSNDVLSMATRTNPAAVDLTPTDFGVQYRRLLNALADTGADMAVANLIDLSGIALLRPAAPEVTGCQRPDTTVRPIVAEDLASINLDPSLLPVPPCDHILGVAEQASIRATIGQFNAEIAAAVSEVEAARGVSIALVDMFALFDTLRNQGLDVRG